MKIELVLDARAELGEGPSWNARLGLLDWLDILPGRLHTYDPASGVDSYLELDEPIGCAARSVDSRFMIGLRSGIWSLDPFTGTRKHLVDPERHLPGNRFNDGKCDPAGRFLAGTMNNAEVDASGSLYSWSLDGRIQMLLTGLRISNGLTWSPDQKTFYFIDTPTRLVLAFDYALDTGAIENPRPVVRIPEEMGWPDGMTSDQEGMLWVAMWGGAKVTRWNPKAGECLSVVPVPALNVTSCIFGGAGLTEIYLTSARKGMMQEQLAQYPLSGGLFKLDAGVKGMPTFEFGGRLG